MNMAALRVFIVAAVRRVAAGFQALVICGAGYLSGGASADLQQEILTQWDRAIPIIVLTHTAVGGYRATGLADLGTRVATRLEGTGMFRSLYPWDRPVALGAAFDTALLDASVLGAHRIFIEGLQDSLGWRIRWQLVHSSRRRMYQQTFSATAQVAVEQRIAAAVFERLVGMPALFDAQILYVRNGDPNLQEQAFLLEAANANGGNARILYASDVSIMSPAWAPDGRRIAFVSFASGRSAVVLRDFDRDGTRTLLANERFVSAPAFSPDGRTLALALARDANVDLYALDLHSGDLRRLTSHYGIDTDPAWAPDGGAIVFSSNRAGGPQIYRLDLETERIGRLTFAGEYNVSPSFLPGGNGLAFVHVRDGVRHIAIMNTEGRGIRILQDTAQGESPSVSPNGMMLIYATVDRGRRILMSLSLDGRVRQRLSSTSGDVWSPTWLPLLTAP